MKTARFETMVTMIIAASAVGARGIACGPCNPPDETSTVSWPPPPELDAGVSDTEITQRCAEICGSDVESCAYGSQTSAEGIEVNCNFGPDMNACTAGRRPEALDEAAFTDDPGTVAGWLGRMAYLEGAAILAFRDLRRDLRAHGAPRRLLRTASRSRRDEVRHARTMAALCRRHGARVPAARSDESAIPTLEQLATLNAVEGCVRESYGAVVARLQAMTAADREVRSAMARIAHEEAKHAALSFAIDGWARARLTPQARARVDAARTEAARALVEAAAQEVPAPLRAALGLPAPDVAVRLAREMIKEMRLAA